MKHPLTALRLAACAAAMMAAGAFAQNSALPVVSDTAPLPAEDRGSTGAIVLEQSPVRAQRDRDFEQGAAGKKTPPSSIGKHVLDATMRAQTKADLQKAREQKAIEFDKHGPAAGTPN
jgi:hypothetical protein